MIKLHPICCLSIAILILFGLPHTYSQANQDPPLPEVIYTSAFLADDPIVEIAPNGNITIHAATLDSCTGGQIFIGIFPEDAALHQPFYRKRGILELSSPTQITARFKLRQLLGRWVDINNLSDQNYGHIAYRLVLFGKKLHYIDRSFAYVRDHEGHFLRAPAVVQGPFVDCVTAASAALSWEFDLPVSCQLSLSPKAHFDAADQARNQYEVVVTDLKPSTEYQYILNWEYRGVNISHPASKFSTAPPTDSDRPFAFAILSDGRANYGGGEKAVEGVNLAAMDALLTQAYIHPVSFVLMPGDLISGYISDPEELTSQYRSLKRIIAPVGSQIPIYEGMGNHDLALKFFQGSRYRDFIPRQGEEAAEMIFAREFVNPANGPQPSQIDYPPYEENVYSFDYGNAHVVMLNNNYMQKGCSDSVAQFPGEIEGVLRPEQLDWLDQDLAQARSRGLTHLFVAAHEPAFPTSAHIDDAMYWLGKRPEILQMRDRFWGILCKHQVLAAFFGHEHNYSRALIDASVNPDFDVPVWQVITGGGGGPFYKEDTRNPWLHTVKKFYPLTHLCIVNVNGEQVDLIVQSERGFQIEKVSLTEF